jgi:hypothetical protein
VEDHLRKSQWNLQQVQDFIPLPMTPSAAMYVTGLDYDTGKPIHVARGAGERLRQRQALHPDRRFGGKGSWSERQAMPAPAPLPESTLSEGDVFA